MSMNQDGVAGSLLKVQTDLQSRLQAIEEERRTITADMERVVRMLRRYDSNPQLSVSGTITDMATEKLGPTDTVRKILQKAEKPLRAKVVLSLFKTFHNEGKVNTVSKDLKSTVNSSLRDLVKSGEVASISVGKRGTSYKWKVNKDVVV